MKETHDYNAATGAGSSKLVVFIDSLSRWVEAIPVHRDPTSAQILDLFMEHVVSRHGVPRRIVTDHGSNLSSRLCNAIMENTGVDLRPSAAEHHEAVGVVERVQQTLVGMTRAANEGGSHWRDHLPFLLLSYRATPHRVTRLSPAMILYGRELRLPAQLDVAEPDQSSGRDTDDAVDLTPQPTDVHSYAHRLHSQLVYAWRHAYDATRSAQGSTVADTVLRSAAPPQFAVGDRVARRLYDHANKLDYTYAGSYRVKSVVGAGRYELQDLENNHVVSEFDASNLRPYRTLTDAEQLQPDEYLVDELLNHRSRSGRSEYLVKWRGYSRQHATWESRAELERRCAELISAYNAAPPTTVLRRRNARGARLPSATPAESADTPAPNRPDVDPSAVPSHLPYCTPPASSVAIGCTPAKLPPRVA